jgi:hypothetical protein
VAESTRSTYLELSQSFAKAMSQLASRLENCEPRNKSLQLPTYYLGLMEYIFGLWRDILPADFFAAVGGAEEAGSLNAS